MAVVANPSIAITVPIDPTNYSKISNSLYGIFVNYWDSNKEKYITESVNRTLTVV